MISEKPVLVIGSTGYFGGCLVPLLLESGYRIAVIADAEAVWKAVERIGGDTGCHFVRKYDEPCLKKQYDLNPHPVELHLRNHV